MSAEGAPAAPTLADRGRQVLDHPVAGPVVKVALAYVVLVEVLVQLLFGRVDLGPLSVGRMDAAIPRGVLLDGMVIGSLYALVGMGLILVYRANRIINFAQAQLGAVPAIVGLLLIAKQGVPYLVVVPFVLIGAALVGAGTEVLVVRRFANAPRLILTVATIGVGFIFIVLEFVAKDVVTGELIETVQLTFPTPFRGLRFRMGPTTFTGDHVMAVIVVGALVLAVSAFFRFTDMGIAVRASAENGERAALLGIPVRRVSTVVWALAAVLSAICIFLRVPLVGMPLGSSVGLGVLLFGLVAAVIARMESLPTAFLGGMLIGIIDRAALFSTRRASLAIAVMLPVVLIALLAQRGRLARAFDTGASTWQAVKEVRPVPAELRLLPEVLRARLLVLAGVVALALAGPFIVGSARAGLATQVLVYAIVGVSLVILTGWSGQISLGQFSLAGIGAAVAGGLAANHGLDFFFTIVVAGVVGAIVAILIGLPAIRIQGLFLSVTTLTFAFAVESFVLRREWFGWLLPGDNKFIEPPVLYGRLDLNGSSEILGLKVGFEERLYYVTLVFLVLALLAARSLRRNRSGRVLIGVRDNGRAMQALGVSLSGTRLAAFAISGFIAAVGGALFAYQQGSVDDSTYSPAASILLFSMAVIGGLGSLPGAVLGAIFVLGLPLLPVLRDVTNIQELVAGVGMLAVLMLMPGGLAEGMYRLRDTFLRRVAARHGIHVPSLVADSLVAEQEREAAAEALVAASEVAEGLDVAAVDLTGASATAGNGNGDDPPRLVRCPVCGIELTVDTAPLHDHLAVGAGAGRPS